ncbi:spore germination protein KB [Paenibacillus tianmuensis]|uniref:Spore germination protein KB n=1 Tax=Paenibacillus tianmuensis TaxID=624147 RepID=A0A1G4PWC2_9BACL|nr:endospore germination permease [Paenibacillus tianmuensis]SCW36654.1 spore germination protein KB [Paenibacillus tianmuensis]
MEKAQISTWQFFVLLFGNLLGTSFFFWPGGLILTAKQDAWMVPLWAGAAGVLMALIWIKLAEHYPGETLIQICIKAAGKGVGRVIALLYVVFFVHLSAFVIRIIGDFIKLTMMQRTPLTVLHVMFLLIICYAVIKGIETISRAAELMIPIVTLTFIFIFLAALYEWNSDRFQGMFRMNVWKTVKETRALIAFPFLDAHIFLMLLPYVQSKKKLSFIMAIVVATLALSGITFFIIGVLGVTRASRETYPMFVIVQEIHIGTFFEHLESTIALILLVAIFIKLSVTYYCAVHGIRQLFQVRDKSWLAISLILLISGLTLGFDNVIENTVFTRRSYFEYSLFFGCIFPTLLLVITWIKRLKRQPKEGSS